MRNKCPICNSCFRFSWRKNRRFFWCDFCRKLYDLKDNKYIEILGFDESITKVERIIYKNDDSGRP